MKKQNSFLKSMTFVLVCLLGTIFVVGNAYAWNFLKSEHPNGYNECIAASGRASYNSVRYACTKAYNGYNGNGTGGQTACASWLGPTTSDNSRIIKISSLTGSVGAAIYGMCTDVVDTGGNGTSDLYFTNDGGSITSSTKSFDRSMAWGSPNSVSASINIPLFINGASKSIAGGVTTYSRTVRLWRCNKNDTTSCNYDDTLIYLRLGGSDSEPDPDPIPADCGSWGSVVNGVTSTLIKIKNDSLFSRSSGAVGAWTDQTIYATPADRVAWHACYYPGVQTEAFKTVSKVVGDYSWTGYTEVAEDRCETSVHHVEEKQLYSAIDWHNNYVLSNTVGTEGRSPSGASMGNQAGGDYPTGDYTAREAENEMNLLTGDAGQTITETSTTSSPVKATFSAATLEPKSIYGGTCNKNNSNNVNSAKIDGEHVYPICPATAKFTDANGNYFNPSYPNILGQVPEVPATATTPKVDAYYCWAKVTGKAKSCKDCFGDATCMNNLGCNTCDGNTECTCNDDYQCLQCTNTYDKTDIQVATVSKGPDSKRASVVVPYNYQLDTGIELDTSHTVYAGETVKIRDFWVDINTRYNGVTYDDYATKVPDAKYAAIIYVTSDPSGLTAGSESSGRFGNLCTEVANKITDSTKKPKQCVKLDEHNGSLNDEGRLEGKPHESVLNNIERNAFDASAGDYICAVSAVWPTESNGDKDTGVGGNNKTRYSTPSCVQIAKRPSFQVWGGDLYSTGSINSPLQNKKNVYVDYKNNVASLFKITGGTKGIFGSWVEEGLILGTGTTITVASGAGLAANGSMSARYGNSGAMVPSNGYGWGPLSFANANNGVSSGVGDRKALFNYWLAGSTGTRAISCADNAFLPNGGTCKQINSATNSGIYYGTYGSINLSGTVPVGETYMIESSGTVTITGNIRYNNVRAYNDLGDIPKLIIYAKNVNILCSVDEVDAIIITEKSGDNPGTVNTCYDPQPDPGQRSEDAQNRSNQLKIFGMVITDRINLGRTYGGAAWGGPGYNNGQGRAAEIFDYDSSTLMWSEYMSSASETNTMQVTYQHELAPRY